MSAEIRDVYFFTQQFKIKMPCEFDAQGVCQNKNFFIPREPAVPAAAKVIAAEVLGT